MKNKSGWELPDEVALEKIKQLNKNKIIELNRFVESVYYCHPLLELNSNDIDSIIEPELKVIHKTSRLLYTVDSVSINDVTLQTPEGECFLVSSKELEKEYELA